ncbi:hypothetical protein FGE12_10820 [Aggregicoccus sp. 17bor-14]|uniref:hypothetical protein n=1 Tax=Myxococcaceae TaxID=31 RepID=UPI00129C1375|nr:MULTISPECIES: hypothetical protein [Myxococcaceae]MBF5042880.1 hypothetical protein [Simulacricoccus sp. 17bor-14]MRI88647.1 hypothetical protein [Aggregicoccus sp. 17bor-14]
MTLLICAGQAFGADAKMRAKGTFVVTNTATGEKRGLANASIELCDEDGGGMCSVFARGTTGPSGEFDVSGTSGDWAGDLPELEVRIRAENPGVRVKNRDGHIYCFKTRTVENVHHGQVVDFGEVSPLIGRNCTYGGSAAVEQGAWMIYRYATEAFDFLRGASTPDVFHGVNPKAPGTGVGLQEITWPHDDAASSGGVLVFDRGGFLACCGSEWSYRNITQAYTVGVMAQQLGPTSASPLDWMGSFPAFLLEVMSQASGRGTGPLCTSTGLCGTIELPPHTSHAVGGLEPVVADLAILWDLLDAANGEDHDRNGSVDQTTLSLDQLWEAMRNDPVPSDDQHNHPRNIVELGHNLTALRPDLATPIRLTFHENHVVLP